MPDESLYLDGTLRDCFLAAVARGSGATAAQRLDALGDGPEDLHEQREEARRLLSEGGKWAAKALSSAGIDETAEIAVRDAEDAFNLAQHLDAQLLRLSQLERYNDVVALLVDSVKRACYHTADLGPTLGGRFGSPRAPGEGAKTAPQIEPHAADLQAVGSALGEALLRFGELRLGDPVEIAIAILSPVPA